MKDVLCGWFEVGIGKFMSAARVTGGGLLALGILALLPMRDLAQSAAINPAAINRTPVLGTNYTIVSRGPNSRVWRRALPIATNQQGQIAYRTNSFTEVATGLCHLDGTNWVESSATIAITPSGGMATNGQHQVVFATDINSSNAVKIATPEGKMLNCHIMGISYFDTSTGSNVLFAELQDANGLLVRSNRVLYPDAFTGGSRMDVRYTYNKASFEQDLVIRQQLPDPSVFGLFAPSVQIQLWTEFFKPPAPAVTRRNGNENLDFGSMKMGPGKAFVIGSTANATPVQKQWITNGGRVFLIESVPFTNISAKLRNLPAPGGSTTNSNGSQQSRLQGFPTKLPPAPAQAQREDQPIKLAVESPPQEPGFVMDFDLVNWASDENGDIEYGELVFNGDTTYVVTGPVFVDDTLTLESGTVVKFTDVDPDDNYGEIVGIQAGNVISPTDPFAPAVLTSVYDNSVGDAVASGIPVMGSYNFYLSLEQYCSLGVQNLRVAYAATGIQAADVLNCQFVSCSNAIVPDSYAEGVSAHRN